MNRTGIEYADLTWNPITGCTNQLECREHCWARKMALRLRGRNGYPADDPFRPAFHPDRLIEPSQRAKPARIATCFMADMFCTGVPAWWIESVWETMRACPHHTFLILTKQPQRFTNKELLLALPGLLPNVWVGVSCCNQATADERIPWLLKCPAAIHWLSLEPILAPINIAPFISAGIDWCVVGGESGHGAKLVHADWVRTIRDQCQQAQIPFFFKQWGVGMGGGSVKATGRVLDGREWSEMPRSYNGS